MRSFYLALLLPMFFCAILAAQNNPVPFVNQPLSPETIAPATTTSIVVTVNGSGFVPSSVVNLDNAPVPTVYSNNSQLFATVQGTALTEPGVIYLTVTNPAPGGGTSNPVPFTVTNPDSALTFSTTNLTVGNAPERVVTADFNGDGLPDIATADYLGNTVSLLLGNSDGTFQAVKTFPAGFGPFAIATGDFNGDGKLDIVVANLCVNQNCSNSPDHTARVSILLGNGDGTFQPPVQYITGEFPYQVKVADFNGDGKLDLAVTSINASDFTSSICILLGNGDGTFQSFHSYPSGRSNTDVAVGDFNDDGVLDLAIPTNGADIGIVAILLGNGDGSFRSPNFVQLSTVSYLDSIVTADVNGDRKLDLIVGGYNPATKNGVLSVLLGNGDGSFQNQLDFSLGINSFVTAITVGDFDGDGLPDLAVPESGNPGLVAILLGQGDGNFNDSINVTAGFVPQGIAAADFNGDGRLDIVTGNIDSTISVLRQAGIAGVPSSAGGFSTVVGTEDDLTVVLHNAGSGVLTISSLSTNDPTEFGAGFDCNGRVLPDSLCFINVGFSPKAAGPRSATLTINDDSLNGSPQTVALSGFGIGASVLLTPDALDFGNQTLGTKSLSQTSTLRSSGIAPLIIGSLGLSGANTGFAAASTCPISVPLNPAATCTITASFKPKAVGPQAAAVIVTDNAFPTSQALSLTGTGVLPQVAFSKTTLRFPPQGIFTISNSQKVTLTNNGLGILTVRRISAIGQFLQTNNCGALLQPGASCEISLRFAPRPTGLQRGVLLVDDNAPGAPQRIALQGIATRSRGGRGAGFPGFGRHF